MLPTRGSGPSRATTIHFGVALFLDIAFLAMPACDWATLEAIGPAANASLATVDANGLAQVPPSDADVADTADAATVADASPGDAAPTQACTSSQSPIRQWTFDTNTDGWSFYLSSAAMGTLTWSSSMGNPSPGALEVSLVPPTVDASLDGGSASSVLFAYFGTAALGNLSERVASAWIWLDSGAAQVKFYSQDGAYKWEDNGTVHLTPHLWTCLSLPLSSPADMDQYFDITNIGRIGFQIESSGGARLYIDTIRYY